MGDFEVKYEDLAGRIGILETRHGKLETPAFFPVLNPSKPEISVEEIREIGFKSFITNSYLIKKNFGKINKIHDFFNSNDLVIMTDSGAYQILQFGDIEAENREIVEYEVEIAPDIAVILDVPTGEESDVERVKYTVLETLRRADEVKDIVEKSSNEIIWVHPIQGGRHLDLLAYSAREADKREVYRFLALGSPTVLMQNYDYVTLIDMIFTAKANVSRGKPLHLFGGGVPHIIPFAVSLGVDSFDSASYIIYARDDRYISRGRVYRLEDLQYFPCSCPVCRKYSPKDLLEMPKDQRTKLLAVHNLYAIKEEINATKQAIYEGRLFEYLQEKSRVHPSLYAAFKRLLKYKEYLEKYDPRVRGDVKGVMFYDLDSMNRPEVVRHDRYVQAVERTKEKAVIVCWKGLERPYFNDERAKAFISDNDVYVFMPFYGIVPIEVSGSFPYSQSEFPEEIDEGVLIESAEKAGLELKRKGYKKVELVNCEEFKELLKNYI
ncbi:MAG: tRNA guanosine(15) transglycosylase TgtA [Thermoprotei archaeon]